MKLALVASVFLLSTAHVGLAASEARMGQRPYEMEWANRKEDLVPPLVDFEDLQGWKVELRDALATLKTSREQQLWGNYVGRLVYRKAGPKPEIRLQPPQPLPVRVPFDAVALWCYGNNWAYAPDPQTPQVNISVVFANSKQETVRVSLGRVDWKEWHLMHRRLSPEDIAKLKDGAVLREIVITEGHNAQDRILYFDNLAAFTEVFPPLTLSARPRRNLTLFPGQSAGVNTGAGTLPFPTREETILPPNLIKPFQTKVSRNGNEFVFTYEARDGRLQYRYQPETGTWLDWQVTWQFPRSKKNTTFRPCVGGGVFGGGGTTNQLVHLATTLSNDCVESRWEVKVADKKFPVTFRYRLWNKSLVMDVLAPGGWVQEVRWGRAENLENPRLVTQPYYPAEGKHPAVVVFGATNQPLFITGHVDWYRSNGSSMWANPSISDQSIRFNGGTRYRHLNNGRLNDCFERFFLIVTPHYEETLPVIANPVSPWKHITGTRLWYAYGATDRKRDAEFWRTVHRWGMTDLVITDHETMWRDGGESFTFRTRPAPGKGGEQGQYAYARLMQDELGFVYGPYNNFTDLSPVNEFWHWDMASRTSDNQLQKAWARCYAPKPAKAVEFCERLSPIIQKQFRFSTAYCDVHTAVPPWARVDYDARVPGAGTMAAVFYAYGEIMLLQKAAWQGPVYSEGNYHAFYMGLTDGNYAQDQAYRPAENPWLVDYDLRRLHDLGCNFGMGNTEMFYPGRARPRPGSPEMETWLDRFMAATVAFGHSGFLCFDDGMRSALRSYYLLLPLHRRYCLTNAVEIKYLDAQGRALETTAAVADGTYRRSQVAVRYADGTCIVANGHPTERLRAKLLGREVNLPPNGFGGWTPDKQVEVWSTDVDGHRHDYAVSPEHLFIDGRGRYVRRPLAAGNGLGICRKLAGQTYEILLFEGAECGFALPNVEAVALDKNRNDLGPAMLRRSRGLTYVVPIQGAFSYRLKAIPPKRNEVTLQCERDVVVPGEEVMVRGRSAHKIVIPVNAKAGERLWFERDGAWIDFTVVPLVETHLALSNHWLQVNMKSHLAQQAMFDIQTAQTRRSVLLAPGKPTTVNIALPQPKREDAQVMKILWTSGGMTQQMEYGLLTLREIKSLLSLMTFKSVGIALRGQKERADMGNTGALVDLRQMTCGETTRRGWFVHPPYMGGVGFTWMRHDPLSIPQLAEGVALRAWVGKANGSDLGDGIEFRVVVLDARGNRTVAEQMMVKEHGWQQLQADLSPWMGQQVVLQLETDAGPANNTSGDWGCWADVRLETLKPMWHYQLAQSVDSCRREPGPFAVSGLTTEMLRKARRGWLQFEGRGVEGPGAYAMKATLNQVQVGILPAVHAPDEKGAFSKARMPLPIEALATLGRRNHLRLFNPNRDYFAVRRFWLELELADGRRASSDIAATTFTQPPGWPTAEGQMIPFEEEVAVDIWFDVDK